MKSLTPLWILSGILLVAVGCVLLYIWFRFEWQFGIGAIVATLVGEVLAE